jgi:HK97 family phage portal protein
MAILQTFLGWFRGGGALTEQVGEQRPIPSAPLSDGLQNIGPDGAMQIAAVWSCVERRANVVASLPFFAYKRKADGQKELARTSRLFSLLHDSPNARMTPFEFWRAMMMNHDLRGNAYARIDRDEQTGEALSLWPMPADQVTQYVLKDGSLVYIYQIGDDKVVLAAESVLHLKGLGNGTTGLSKLEFMRGTTDEAAKAQSSAAKLFGTNGKPSGVLMVDKVLTPAQRDAVRKNFGDIALGNTGRLYVLEADMKYQQLSLSPEDQQLLETRQFSIEEICRWFDVPPVLVYHSNVTTWGSGIESILDGWHKLSVRPVLINIEQAVSKQVMTASQRARQSVEFNFDALLRGNLKDRLDAYATATQNGVYTRAECRQLENLPPIPGSDELTAQSNLVPLSMLGKIQSQGGSNAPDLPTAQ